MDSEWDTSYPLRGTTLSGLGRGRGLRAATNAPSVGALANQTAVMTLSNDDWNTGTSSQTNGSQGTNFSRSDEPRGAGSRPMKCFKCQGEGHMSRECPNEDGGNSYLGSRRNQDSNGGPSSRGCFKCGKEGHMSRECPNQGSGDNRSRACFKCGEDGHMSRDCPNQASGDSRPRGCFKCGEEGHMSRDCPNQASGDGRPRGCFKCGEEGHMSRDCPNQGSSDNRSRACRKCGEEGHMARDCPQGGGGDNKGCFRCGAEGHMSRDCTEPATTADGKPREVNYVPPELDENEGAIFSSGLSAGINFDKYDSIPIKVTGEDATVAINSFEEARLRQVLMDNIRKAKYLKPTPVQKACIPAILARRDLMACAQTGSGKTAAFLIPILNILLTDGCAAKSFQEIQYPEVIVLAPTRELAIQIHGEAVKFSYGSVIKCQLCYGGTSVGHQIQKLKQGVNILIATPGRMLDFMEKNVINLSNLKFLVLDEADRMLDMGFKPDIDKVFMNPYFPPKEQRNVVMFSATFPDAVQHMAMEYLNRYLYAVVGVVGSTNPDVSLQFFEVRQGEKRNKLIEILRDVKDQKVIVFVASKKLVDFLATHLCNAGFAATSMHGDRFQSQREEALRAFITGKHNILIATSVAARGLDVPDVAYVINYDLPNDPEEYVHKIGRTGRVGNTGYAISFYDPDKDSAIAGALVQKLKGSDQAVPEFLLAAIGGAGSGYGYGTGGGGGRFANSDVRRHGGYQADAGRGSAPQPIESEENWD